MRPQPLLSKWLLLHRFLNSREDMSLSKITQARDFKEILLLIIQAMDFREILSVINKAVDSNKTIMVITLTRHSTEIPLVTT